MLGQIAPCGTGLCDIILDEEEHFKLYREMKSEHQKAMKEIVEDEDEEDDEIITEECNNIQFQYQPPTKSDNLSYEMPVMDLVVN